MDNNIIQQSTGAGSMAMPRAEGFTYLSIGSGLETFGKGLNSLGEIDKKQGEIDLEQAKFDAEKARILAHQQEEDGKVLAANAVSNARVQWSTDLQSRMETATPGAPNFTPDLLKDYDKYVEESVKNANTSAAQKYTLQHLMAYRPELANQALNFEAAQRKGWRVDQYSDAVDNYATIIANDPSKYELGMTALAQTLPDVDPVTREKLVDYKAKKLNEAYWMGRIQSDPESAYAELKIGHPDASATGSAPASDIQSPSVVPDSNVRGIRNNNPGNIVKSEIPWEGKIPGIDPKYETFASPELGIRATAKNLLTYSDQHGLKTVQGIISNWAPKSENNVPAYVAQVSQALGVKPDQKLDMHTPQTLSAFTTAIINHENGDNPYTPEQLNDGVMAAMGKKKLNAPQASGDTQPSVGSSDTQTPVSMALANTTLDERLKYSSIAETLVKQRQREAQVNAERLAKQQDQTFQAFSNLVEAGKTPTPAFVSNTQQVLKGSPYEPVFNEMLKTAPKNLSYAAQPLVVQQAEMNSLLAKGNDPERGWTPQEQKRYNELEKITKNAIEEIKADPYQAALERGVIQATPPMNVTDLTNIGAQIANRKQVTDQVSTWAGKPISPFTPTESKQVVQYVEALPAGKRSDVLGQIATAINNPDQMRAVASQFGKQSQTIATAAFLASQNMKTTQGRPVSELYLLGDEALKENRAKIDNSKEMGVKAQIYGQLQNVYASQPAMDMAADTAYKVYAAHKAEGIDDVNNAINIATGGIMDVNGMKIARPYGWTESEVKQSIGQVTPASIGVPQVNAGGHQMKTDDLIQRLPSLPLRNAPVSNGYYVQAGADVVRKPDGNPLVIVLQKPVDTVGNHWHFGLPKVIRDMTVGAQ